MSDSSIKSKPQVAFVTGSSSGIGLAIAQNFLAQGYDVVGCSRGKTKLDNPRYTHFQASVSDEQAIRAVFAEIRKRRGRVDVCVCAAGVAAMNHILTTPYLQAKEIIETNVLGTFLTIQEAAKLMMPGGGSIVAFSSIAVSLSLPGESIYVASKAAVESLVKVAAQEFASFGISINAIAPGPVATSMIASVPSAKIEELLKRAGRKRMTEISEIVSKVQFFSDIANRSVSGSVTQL